MDRYHQEQAFSRGLGRVKKVLHTATILRKGWELDNEGWIVQMGDGRIAALTTNHGGVCAWPMVEAKDTLKQTEASADSIREAIALMEKVK